MAIFAKGVCSSVVLLGVSGIFGATVIGTQIFGRDNTGKPGPRFSNGYTIFYDRDQQSIVAYDSSGVIRTQSTLSLPDAARIMINDVTASKLGTIAVSATAVSRDEQQVAFVLIWIRADGQMERAVRTTPFGARKVAFDDNGHLWAFGLLQNEHRRTVAEHDTLREYDAQGVLVQSTLPRSQFTNCSAHPAGRSALLVSNGSRLGVYSQDCQAYIELTPSGQFIAGWNLLPLGTVKIAFGGLSSSGTFYWGGFDSGDGSSPGRAVVYRLDRASGSLVPVELPDGAASTTMLTLLGVENEDLVFYGKPSSIIRIRLD